MPVTVFTYVASSFNPVHPRKSSNAVEPKLGGGIPRKWTGLLHVHTRALGFPPEIRGSTPVQCRCTLTLVEALLLVSHADVVRLASR